MLGVAGCWVWLGCILCHRAQEPSGQMGFLGQSQCNEAPHGSLRRIRAWGYCWDRVLGPQPLWQLPQTTGLQGLRPTTSPALNNSRQYFGLERQVRGLWAGPHQVLEWGSSGHLRFPAVKP